MSAFVMVKRELLERVCIPVCRESYPAIEELRAVLAQEAGPVVELQEPVAWASISGDGKVRDLTRRWDIAKHWLGPVEPLYTSTPAPVAVVLPKDVIRDAERYRFLRDDAANSVRDFCIVKKFWGGTFSDQILVLGDADSEIDACLDKVKELNQ